MTRKQRINRRVYDLLMTLRFTKKSDPQRAADLIMQIIDEIDEIVEGEIELTGSLKPRAKR